MVVKLWTPGEITSLEVGEYTPSPPVLGNGFGVQTPAVHVPLQAAPQAPQLDVSVASVASQPFTGFPSQSPSPALQVYVHAAAVHAAVAPVLAPHAIPHAPHEAVDERSASHPSEVKPLQSAYPEKHRRPHTIVEQKDV